MPVGKTSTYSLTEGLYLDFEPIIQLLDPFDVPLTGTYGADGKSALANNNAVEKLVQWHDDTLLTPRSTAGATATTGELVLTTASGDRLRFSTGDLIRTASNEVIRVTGYGTTADTLTITRGYASTTAGTLTTGTVLVGIGTALPEGADPENPRFVDRTNRFNYTQIFGPTAVQVSDSDNVVKKYGLESTTELDYQLGKATKQLAVSREQAVIYGMRNDDTTNMWRSMGGLAFFMTENVDATTTTLTEAKLLDQIQAVWDKGGNVDRAVLGSKQKRIVSGFTTDLNIQVGRTDNGRGQVVDYFDSDFGRVSMLINRWCRTSDLFLFGRDQAEFLTLRGLRAMPLAKTGDSTKWMLVAEHSLRFARARHAARFSALT